MTDRSTILVVDDDSRTRHAVKDILEMEGFEVACATNGQEALDYLDRAEPPLAILLDLSMPVMDGWQFRDRQRQTLAIASVPVFIASGEPHLAWTAASLGVAGCFRKPVDMGAVLRAVHALVKPDGLDTSNALVTHAQE